MPSRDSGRRSSPPWARRWTACGTSSAPAARPSESSGSCAPTRATRTVASIEDVRSEVVLLELRELSVDHPSLVRGKLERVLAHDAGHGSAYAPTLRAYLDAFGDISEAAARISVHPNTFRYRMRRIVELFELDLDERRRAARDRAAAAAARGGRRYGCAGRSVSACDREPRELLRDRRDAEPRARSARSRRPSREDERLGDVLLVVAAGGGRVARQGEARESRQRDVRGTAEARLEHPAAPDGDAVLDADVVDAARLEVAADAAGLDVDDAACAERDRVLRGSSRGDRLVEADRRADEPRQLGVPEDVVLGQRLLDEEQVELVELGEVLGVGEGCRRCSRRPEGECRRSARGRRRPARRPGRARSSA